MLTEILEYDDSEARDEHGQWTSSDGGHYHASHKAGPGSTRFGSRNLTADTHVLTKHVNSKTGENILVDHRQKAGTVDVLGSKRGETNLKFKDTKSAGDFLKSKGISHDFGGK